MEIITKEFVRNCIFGIKCNEKWKNMKHVRVDENDRDVKFCSTCEKEVFETRTKDELYTNIQLNRCVSIIYTDNTKVLGHVKAPWKD